MLVRKNIDVTQPLTEEQLKTLDALEERTAAPDEDCPELTEEQLAQFRRVSAEKREERVKQTVTLRLSPQALRKARSLGKGYTSVLSRILEDALTDNEKIERYL